MGMLMWHSSPVWRFHSILPSTAGVFASSSLDLNPFISNDNGNLVEGSDYIATCTPEGFGLVGSPFFIFANCAQEDGNVVRTSYDINNNVSNDNGVLAWNSC
jgi:hypothetical protein